MAKIKYYDLGIENLKILREYFDAVAEGRKPFEVRKNDRDYKPGDKYRLREYIGKKYMPECKHCKEAYCQELLELGYTEEELDKMNSLDYVYSCSEFRSRCGEHYMETYTGRSVIIQIKEVFNLPGELSDYVAFTFDVLNANSSEFSYVEIIENDD